MLQLFGRIPHRLYMRAIPRGSKATKDLRGCIGGVVKGQCEALWFVRQVDPEGRGVRPYDLYLWRGVVLCMWSGLWVD
jgi:hypothetical protein